jgi:hypothetical protein
MITEVLMLIGISIWAIAWGALFIHAALKN